MNAQIYNRRNILKFAQKKHTLKNMETQKNNPLHGITLQYIINYLVDNHGWEYMASEININCFKSKPSIKSSLNFLRKTPWARKKVEDLYLRLNRH